MVNSGNQANDSHWREKIGDPINVEIERQTQVVVDTIRDTLSENLGQLAPLFEKLLENHGVDVNALGVK